MGVIKPTNSPYNSPIFVVPKKDCSSCYVLDFRKLNSNSHTDKYSMKSVEEYIGNIGRSGSTMFSTLDLSSGFGSFLLHLKAKNSPLLQSKIWDNFNGLELHKVCIALSQYQQLMELTVKGLDNIIVYIDNLLVHNSEQDQHRLSLQLLYDRL
jgi:hypothetical protein